MNRELYEKGLELLREYHEEICFRVMKGRNEGKGNFAYLEDDQIKRERKIAKFLEHLLWGTHLKLENKENTTGCCDAKCIDCHCARYNFHSIRAPNHWCNEDAEGWYCQYECECK